MSVKRIICYALSGLEETFFPTTQGVALGYYVLAFQAKNRLSPTFCEGICQIPS